MTRFSFAGTWKGTGQRRPLAGINQKPKGNQTVLFTPAWGAATPDLPNATAVVLQPFPAATPNTDLQGTARRGGDRLGADPARRRGARRDRRRGGEARERGAGRHAGHGAADPAVVVGRRHRRGRRRAAARAQPQGGLQDERELRVRPISRSATPRAAVGQLDDGRVILVAVDGGRPGYSVGMTTYELAQTMARLGAVTAAALEPGKSVTAAFQGQVLNRPSGRAGELPVKEALLVQYVGVYAPPPSVRAARQEQPGAAGSSSPTRSCRPSTVTASWSRPTADAAPVDTGRARARHVPLHVDGLRRRGHLALERLRRPTTRTASRPPSRRSSTTSR